MSGEGRLTGAQWDALRLCFGCVRGRSCQLGLDDHPTADGIGGTVTFSERHAGGPSTVHGGFLAAVLDEISGKVAMAAGVIAVTKTLEVQFLKAAPVGVVLNVAAQRRRVEGRAWTIDSRISSADGHDLVTGTGLFITVPTPPEVTIRLAASEGSSSG